jgi:hypothetical protein
MDLEGHVIRLRTPPQPQVVPVVSLDVTLHPLELLPRQFR